MQAKTE